MIFGYHGFRGKEKEIYFQAISGTKGGQ